MLRIGPQRWKPESDEGFKRVTKEKQARVCTARGCIDCKGEHTMVSGGELSAAIEMLRMGAIVSVQLGS